MSFEKEFSELSERCRQHIRAGQIDLYSSCLKEMAGLMDREARYMDELSLLVLAFYIDLSGFGRAPYIDKNISKHINCAVSASSLKTRQVLDLFVKVIQPDIIANHAMTIEESLYLFKLCLEDELNKAEYILAQI